MRLHLCHRMLESIRKGGLANFSLLLPQLRSGAYALVAAVIRVLRLVHVIAIMQQRQEARAGTCDCASQGA